MPCFDKLKINGLSKYKIRYLATTTTQLLLLLSLLLYYHYSSVHYRETGLSLLTYARRIMYFGQYLMLFGSHITIVYFNKPTEQLESDIAKNTHVTGLFILLITSAIISLVSYIYPSSFSIILFGNETSIYNSRVILLSTCGTAFITLASFILLSINKVMLMNSMQILFAFATLCSVFVADSAGGSLVVVGISGLLIALLALIWSRAMGFIHIGTIRFNQVVSFLKFGSSRMLYELIVASLFTIATFAITHIKSDPVSVILSSIGMTMVSLVSVPFSVAGLLVMPKIRDHGVVMTPSGKSLLYKVVIGSLLLTIAGALVALRFGNSLIGLWLSLNDQSSGNIILALSIISSIFYSVHMLLRHPIDVLSERAINLRISAIAALSLVLLISIKLHISNDISLVQIALVNTISFFILGLGSLYYLLKFSHHYEPSSESTP